MSLAYKAIHLQSPFLVSIDGESASGKGTIAKLLAKKLDLIHLETGLMYRILSKSLLESCLNKDCIENSVIDKIVAKIAKLSLKSSPALYTEEVSSYTSYIAKNQYIRQKLSFLQKNFIQKNPRVVVDGRDIGSTIAPNADLKLYLKADITTRAMRRYKQLSENNNLSAPSIDSILESLQQRDLQDKNRAISPLCVPKGAIIIDSTHESAQEILFNILNFIHTN